MTFSHFTHLVASFSPVLVSYFFLFKMQIRHLDFQSLQQLFRSRHMDETQQIHSMQKTFVCSTAAVQTTLKRLQILTVYCSVHNSLARQQDWELNVITSPATRKTPSKTDFEWPECAECECGRHSQVCVSVCVIMAQRCLGHTYSSSNCHRR